MKLGSKNRGAERLGKTIFGNARLVISISGTRAEEIRLAMQRLMATESPKSMTIPETHVPRYPRFGVKMTRFGVEKGAPGRPAASISHCRCIIWDLGTTSHRPALTYLDLCLACVRMSHTDPENRDFGAWGLA